MPDTTAKALSLGPMNPRTLFRPKLPQLKEPCVSCPFRDGNEDAFAEIVRKLAMQHEASDLSGRKLKQRTLMARLQIREEARSRGDFACHQTAYDSNMALKPARERRQCPGATAVFIKAGEQVKRG